MKFLAQDHLYAGNMWDKFQSQKTYIKKVIPYLSTCFSKLHMLVDLEYYFLYGSFGLEIFHTCKKHKNVFSPKLSWAKQISSILGRVSKLAAVTLFSQLSHVGRSFISFFYKSPGLEIWYACFQHNDDAVPKSLW